MLSCLGGSLVSFGGELAGDAPEEPHDEDPELDEDIELVLCLDGIPWTSLRLTTFRNREMIRVLSNSQFTWSPLTNVGNPIVRAGLLFLLLFLLLLFCFSLSLLAPDTKTLGNGNLEPPVTWVGRLRRDPSEMFSQSSSSTLTGTGLDNQAVTLLLPQVLVFLLLRPVPEFLLAFFRFVQMI